MKSLPKRRILALGFVLALGIELIIGAFSYRSTASLVANSDRVRHSQEVIHRLEDVLGDLTGDIPETHRKMANLRHLTADSPEHQEWLDALEPMVQARLARVQEMTASREATSSDPRRAMALANQQQDDLGKIQTLISRMEKEEQLLLEQRDQAVRASTRRTFLTLFIGHMVSFGLLIMVFTFLSREVTERQRAEQVSHGQTETLVKTLNALTAEPTLDIFSRQVLVAIAEQLGAHSASLWFYNPARRVIWTKMLYQGGKFRTVEEFSQLKAEFSVREFFGWKRFVRQGSPVIIRDIQTNRLLAPVRDWLARLNIQTLLCVPLIVAEDTIGCIALGNSGYREYQPQELELVQALARQLCLAIQLTRLAEQGQQSAVLAERNRMAREIHDTLAQGFTGIVVQLEAMEDILRENPEGASAHLLRAKTLARESLAEARRSVRALRPQALEASDLAGALRQLAGQLTAGTPLQVKFSVWGTPRHLPPEIENNLLRIGQEALTNVLKHAQASAVDIDLTFEPERVELSVQDNGRGFKPECQDRAQGFGLVSMRERARVLGGELTLHSRTEGGTQLVVEVPRPFGEARAVYQEQV